MLPTRRRPTRMITTRSGGRGRTVAKVAIFTVAAYIALKIVLVVMAVAVTLVATLAFALFIGVLVAALLVLARR